MVKVTTRTIVFRVTAAVVFLQLAIGGLVTFGFLESGVHIITGLIVLVLTIAALAIALASKPRFRPLVGLSVGMVVLVVIQGILGFITLGSGSQVVAWVHLVTALGIYGMAVAGAFMATMGDRMARGGPDMHGRGVG